MIGVGSLRFLRPWKLQQQTTTGTPSVGPPTSSLVSTTSLPVENIVYMGKSAAVLAANLLIISPLGPPYNAATDVQRAPQAKVFGEPEVFAKAQAPAPLILNGKSGYSSWQDVQFLRSQAKPFSEPETQWRGQQGTAPVLNGKSGYSFWQDVTQRRPQQGVAFADPETFWRGQQPAALLINGTAAGIYNPATDVRRARQPQVFATQDVTVLYSTIQTTFNGTSQPLQSADIFSGMDTYGWPPFEVPYFPQQPRSRVILDSYVVPVYSLWGPRYIVRLPPRSFTLSELVRPFTINASGRKFNLAILTRPFSASVQPRAFNISSASLQRFDIKDPAESVQLVFNMAPDLAVGETLTGTPTVTVSVIEGTDGSPSAILNGAAGFDSTSTQVIQPVTAGVAGCEYQIVVTSPTTNAKKTLTLVGALPVRR